MNQNPLSDLIPDHVYEILESRKLLNQKTLRDHIIRKRFMELKTSKLSVTEAIEKIRADYPYLQSDTIRKIVYHIGK